MVLTLYSTGTRTREDVVVLGLHVYLCALVETYETFMFKLGTTNGL